METLFWIAVSLLPFAVCWWIGNAKKNKLRDDGQNLG